MGEAPVEGPRFSVVWRGYDRVQVEEYVRLLRSAPTGPTGGDPVPEPPEREPSLIDERLAEFFAEREPRTFDVVLRGYDREEVDRYLQQFGA